MYRIHVILCKYSDVFSQKEFLKELIDWVVQKNSILLTYRRIENLSSNVSRWIFEEY